MKAQVRHQYNLPLELFLTQNRLLFSLIEGRERHNKEENYNVRNRILTNKVRAQITNRTIKISPDFVRYFGRSQLHDHNLVFWPLSYMTIIWKAPRIYRNTTWTYFAITHIQILLMPSNFYNGICWDIKCNILLKKLEIANVEEMLN